MAIAVRRPLADTWATRMSEQRHLMVDFERGRVATSLVVKRRYELQEVPVLLTATTQCRFDETPTHLASE